MSFDYDSEQLRSFQLSNYVGCSFAALIIYEYSITFGQEIETIWKRKVTVASGLVLVARWMLLLLAAACILTPTARGCTAAGNIVHVMFAVGYLPVNLFLSLRIFALWGRNWTLFTIVFVLGLAPSLTNSLGAADFTFAPFVGPVSACLDFLKPVYAANFNRNYTISDYTAQGALLLQDLTVISLTWIKSYRRWKDARRAKVPVSILECILRDGTVYFVIMFAINITQLVIFNAESGEVLGVYVNAMPLVLVSRFMMNLRQVAGPADSFSISTVAFQANTDMLGNIAEPIEFHVTQASSVGSSETRCSEDGEIPMFTLREGGTQTYDTTAQHGGSTSA